MSIDTQLRQAERDRDWVRLAILLRRANYISVSSGCPHCCNYGTGYGAWDDDISDEDWRKIRDEIGLPYRCRIDMCLFVGPGCGQLFVILPPGM